MSSISRAVSGFAAQLIGVALLNWGGVSTAYAQSHPEQTPFLQMLSYLHSNDGYTVAQGEVTPFQGCATYVDGFGTCFGNNTATPYYVLNVPLGGATLPTFMTGSGPGPGFGSTGPAPGYTSLNTLWQLKTSEALVTIITMPPPGAYFSQETYMVERDARYYSTTQTPMPLPGQTQCVPGTTFLTGSIPNRVSHNETPDCQYDVFGFINNAINNALIQQQATFSFSGGPGCTSSVCAIAIITTPNQQVFMDVKNAFIALGYNPNLLFEEGMATGSGTAPSPLLYIAQPTGLPQPAYNPDTMATILRYTIPSGSNLSGTASYAWEQAIGTNVLTFRVTQQTGGTITPISTPTITSQSCNTNESGFAPMSGPTLCSAGAMVQAHEATLKTLLLTWFQNHVSASYTFGAGSTPGPATGFNCLTTGISCSGPSPDNNGYRSFASGELTAGLPIIGVGILHSASPSDTTSAIPANNAVYTGLALNDDALNSGGTGENIGIADQTQTNLLATGFAQGNLEGSAAKILNDLGMTLTDTAFIADLPNLYVVVFNQTSSTCVIPGSTASGCNQTYVVNIPSTTLPPADPTKITERGYLYPPASASSSPTTAMQVGADPDYMASPFILYAH